MPLWIPNLTSLTVTWEEKNPKARDPTVDKPQSPCLEPVCSLEKNQQQGFQFANVKHCTVLVTQIAQQNEAPNNTKLCFHHPDKEEELKGTKVVAGIQNWWSGTKKIVGQIKKW